jgi:hypothetical protein
VNIKTLLLFFLLSKISIAQEEIMQRDSDQIVWFGVDFSVSNFIGKDVSNKNSYVKALDEIVLKISLEKLLISNKNKLGKYRFLHDYKTSMERNKRINPAEIFVSMEKKYFENTDIQKIVNKCNSPLNEQGTGLIIIVENINPNLNGSISYFAVFLIFKQKK